MGSGFTANLPAGGNSTSSADQTTLGQRTEEILASLAPDIGLDTLWLTPETLVEMVRQQLEHIDGQIFEMHRDTQAKRAIAEQIQDAASHLNLAVAEKTGLLPTAENIQTYRELAEQQESPEAKAILNRIADALESGKPVYLADCSKQVSKLEELAKDLTNGTEITMIRMQQLIEMRSRTIMWASNTQKSMDDAMDQTVRNIG